MNRRQFLKGAATATAAATATFVAPGQVERFLLRHLGPPNPEAAQAAEVARLWRARFDRATDEAKNATVDATNFVFQGNAGEQMAFLLNHGWA